MRGLLRNDRGATELIQFALVLPALLLVVLGGINVALVQHTRELATVAAAEGARVAAVTWEGGATAQTAGVNAATQFLDASGMATGVCPAGSGFGTVNVAVGPQVGSNVVTTVDWCYMNLFGGLMTLLGGGPSRGNFSGTVEMTVRKEGW